MNKFKEAIILTAKKFYIAASRFPLTLALLAAATILLCYMTSQNNPWPIYLEKLAFTLVFGAVISASMQFIEERKIIEHKIPYLHIIFSLILTILYYLILLPAAKIDIEVSVRTMVGIFAFIGLALWAPSFKGKSGSPYEFKSIPLTHLKSVFISILYSLVLMLGVMAILAAIDNLLFNIDSKSYAYTAICIWVFFFPFYYLSLIPKFNSELETDIQNREKSSTCPKFLEILISYIAIPLLAVFSLVLAIYFIKIIFTQTWPIGVLGPIVLGYSSAGILVFLLAAVLNNRFSELYRLIFPKVLIPIVILQLVSVGIRLNAYGITESRYYLALFGIFALVTGIFLSLKPTGRNSVIVILAVCFGLFSITPPVDAFNTTKISQISRVEKILIADKILINGALTPSSNVTDKDKAEITNILAYLNARGYDTNIKWLPKKFNPYNDMKKVIGFEPFYGSSPNVIQNKYAQLDENLAIDVSGFDNILKTNSSMPRYNNPTPNINFEVKGIKYTLIVTRPDSFESTVKVIDTNRKTLISTPLYAKAKEIIGVSTVGKNVLPPSALTLNVSNEKYSMRIVFQSINIAPKDGADYSFYVMFKAK